MFLSAHPLDVNLICTIRNAECKNQNPDPRMPDPGFRMGDSEYE